MYNRWGGGSVQLDDQSDLDETRSNVDIDRASVKSLEETQQSWLLGASEVPKKKGVDLGCVIISRRMCCVMFGFFVFCGFIAGLVTLIIFTLPHKHHSMPAADNYTVALKLALSFFDAQHSGPVPKGFPIAWRGNSGMTDGLANNVNGPPKDLSGGFYDAGDNIKFVFPGAYAMTMLCWSVVEYKEKYIAAGEYAHARNIIEWGVEFLFKTFNYSVNTTTITYVYAQVGSGSDPSIVDNDHYCWERPETMDYPRYSYAVTSGSDLAGEMAATMAAASIVFKDNANFSKRCIVAAQSLLNFAQDHGKRNRYSSTIQDASSATFYNSSGYWDEFIWANAWVYFATGNVSYLARATTSGLAQNAHAQAVGSSYYGLLSWDNKLLGAQVRFSSNAAAVNFQSLVYVEADRLMINGMCALLTWDETNVKKEVILSRLRMMQGPPYPYEALLEQYNNETNLVMCSYLPYYKEWNRTKGGMMEFNYGNPATLQYVATAAFVASLYSDYLTTSDIPVWQCGPNFYLANTLKEFARSQIDYILGNNPLNMSYVVGYGKKYPLQVHHRAASTPYNKVRYSCTGGFQFRDSPRANPNIINGAMVGGPNKFDKFVDHRANYTFTEPTVAGNAGLIGALISLSTLSPHGVDRQTLFSNLPSMYVGAPPPPPPWRP